MPQTKKNGIPLSFFLYMVVNLLNFNLTPQMLCLMFCRGGGGANSLHRSKHLYQCPHDDWKGFHPTTALSGEGEKRVEPDITLNCTTKHLNLNSPSSVF